jgi:RHS repeat-associated protein
LPTDFHFTGQHNDSDIKLYQMGARWYNALTGRWISADTLVPNPNNPQDFNRYAYVQNNPVRYVDPTGHCTGLTGFAYEVCKAAVITGKKVVDKLNEYREDIFFPDEDTTFTDRLEACSVVGGGSVLFAATGVEIFAGTLTTAATTGGATTLTTAATSTTAAACADGDCTNEVNSAIQTGKQAIEALSADGDPTNELLKLRQAYETQVRGLAEKAQERFFSGQPVEEIARWAHGARRELGVIFKDMTPPELLEQIYARNIAKYGDQLGPTIEWLLEKGKTWEDIIESAVQPGGADIIPKLMGSG